MPVIRVDDEVYEAIRKKAVPLKDCPNDVLRRELGMPAKEKRSRKKKGGQK